MSPECTQLEMAEEEINLSRLEIDDDIPIVPENNAESQNEERTEKQEEHMSEEFNNIENASFKKCRSMSEGTSLAPQLTDTGDITVFPNLQDNVLESLGLHADQSRDRGSERLTEEEIEEKFHTLALIFSIDSKSLAQRRELQKRQRDQAQENFAVEVARLEQGIHRLAPLCVDREVKELVTALLTRQHIIVKAAQRISISTQVYGGVQQEFRITAAVNLMLVHLRNIQQQRDTVKRQLQCTKKMLQESTTTSSEPNSNVVARRVSTTANGRVVTRRRASIATIPRPLDSPSASGPAGIAAVTKRAVRRISADAYSEYSAKPWDSRHRPDWMPVANPAAGRLSRPSRIELGLDLTKIHEGSVDADSTANINDGSDSEMNSFGTPTGLFPVSNFFTDHQKAVRNPETFRDHTVYVLAAIIKFITYCWNRWMRNGTTHQMILFVIAIIGLSTIFMLNIAMWSRFFRQGILYNGIPWKWVTWDELWDIIFEVRNTGPHPI